MLANGGVGRWKPATKLVLIAILLKILLPRLTGDNNNEQLKRKKVKPLLSLDCYFNKGLHLHMHAGFLQGEFPVLCSGLQERHYQLLTTPETHRLSILPRDAQNCKVHPRPENKTSQASLRASAPQRG